MASELSDFGVFGAPTGEATPFAVGASRDPRLAKLAEQTAQLFPGGLHIAAEEDPEIAEEAYLVFHVRGHGDVREVADLMQKWHDAAHQLIPDHSAKLRLSVDMKP